MDSKVVAELSAADDDESEMSTNASTSVSVEKVDEKNISGKEVKAASISVSTSKLCSESSLIQVEESVIKSEGTSVICASSGEADKGRKYLAQLKNPLGKRKVKVDWTPELHKKFVKAVEHLGVDKAVPSRILELMGIDCLTRHNVASHLQKYRSHQKHVLAREAEAANWSRRRHGGPGRKDVNPWSVSTVGFSPVAAMPHFRPPLHVWGHPSADQSFMHLWPKHLAPSPLPLPSPVPAWVPGHPPPPLLPGDPSFWYYHHHDVPARGMPCFPPSFTPSSFPTPTVPGIPPSGMYRAEPVLGVPSIHTEQTLLETPLDFQPQSKENIDDVIGDVLSKPWLPLPLGLKPPSIDSVIVELQRQGISKIPPSCA